MTRRELQELLQTKTFLYDRSHYSVIEVSGKDHREWLHRISSQSSFKLKPGEVCTTAFLTGTAGVISYFQMLILEDKAWILAEPQSKEKILAYLDFSHFGEEIKFKEIKQKSYFEIVGKHEDLRATYKIPAETWNAGGKIYIDAEKPNLPSIDQELYNLLKRSKAWPIDQTDINESNILLEAEVLTGYATDTKGCYPGQEVIAKIITYGRVAKKYIALWSTNEPTTSEISYDGGKAGVVVASQKLQDGYLLLGYILRVAHDKFQTGSELKLGSETLQKFI